MIYTFSGTGNSHYIGVKIAELLGEEVCSINEHIKNHQAADIPDERIVFVVPTYAWRIPRVVSEWILGQSFVKGQKAYFIMTCGDSIGNACVYNARLCSSVGLEYMGTAKLDMPENYIAMFNVPDEETSERIIAVAERKLAGLAERIRSGEKFEDSVSLRGQIYSGIINEAFYKLAIKPHKFTVSDACNGCGLCENLCPTNCVKIVNGKPVWSKGCTHCMACICSCPAEAIEYGKASIGKRRYICKKAD